MNRAPAVLRVGTRGSALAQAQTASVVQILRERSADLRIETVIIRTSGDRQQREVVGAFVKELQEALLRGEIDVAVHSLKDLPAQGVGGLTVAAVPPRADARDVLLSRGEPFAGLPRGAHVGAGSVRRSAQLKRLRADLQILPLVGNVDTRIRKLREGQYDAVVLAAAGLQRLGFLETPEESFLMMPEGSHLHLHVFDFAQMLPAPGQGALALECRADDQQTIACLQTVDHPETRLAVTAERSVLHALGGGCRVPIAAYAEVQGSHLHLTALVAMPEGDMVITDRIDGDASQAEALGEQLAHRLRTLGASHLLGTTS